MKQVYIVGYTLLMLGSLSSCGMLKKKPKSQAHRTITVTPNKWSSGKSGPEHSVSTTPKTVLSRVNAEADAVINTALTFAGVKYKYGGTTNKGMDCSGLLYVSFSANNIPFPRVSYDMATEGDKISVEEVQKGDLLFFRTSRRSGRINHVGLVVDVKDKEVRFIHASTSRGVIVSSLREGYWNAAFVKATRVF
ncbi:C40 family peptidase [Robiginitalea sp.]|nr:C40 family peptidase [Robiginitalea sp.]